MSFKVNNDNVTLYKATHLVEVIYKNNPQTSKNVLFLITRNDNDLVCIRKNLQKKKFLLISNQIFNS